MTSETVKLNDVLDALNSLYDEHDGSMTASDALEAAVAEVRALSRSPALGGEAERLRRALEDAASALEVTEQWVRCQAGLRGTADGIANDAARARAALASEGAELCDECFVYPADKPSKLCPGCEAYKEHQQ